MAMVRVGSDPNYLLLTADDSAGGAPQFLVAELHLDGLSASGRVVHNYATGFEDLADFFQRQADDWRGWAGTRRWESLEGDLEVEARHLYGLVQLRVTMRRVRSDWGNHGWTATGDLTIEPGEQLTQIAKGVRSLAAG
ncbi:MAG TPA: DUF6228 family protein [Kribbella sp.]